MPVIAPEVKRVIGKFSLDGIDALKDVNGAEINDGDAAIVFLEDSTKIYNLSGSSGETEDIPNVVMPTLSAGDKRWILVSDIPHTLNLEGV
jgi:hypothetical protein